MFAVVEDYLEHRAGTVNLSTAQEGGAPSLVVKQRYSVSVKDMLQVAVGRAAGIIESSTIALAGPGEISADAILFFVLIENTVALVIAGLADQPTENAG